jgi:hypothetical protein
LNSTLMRCRAVLPLLVSVLLHGVGCQEGDEARQGPAERSIEQWAKELSPVESFAWDDQPISYAPPPASWERQREQSGGIMGARFVLHESGGQSIHIGEVTKVGQRDRCSELESLMAEIEELSPREFSGRLQRARPYLREPINRSETEAFEAANERLDEARDAFRAGDVEEARSRIAAALWDLRWVKYSLEEVVGPALFTGKGYSQIGRVEIAEPVESSVSGAPALTLDYLVDVRSDEERVLTGRRVYFEHNNRLFEAAFQGVAAYRGLFDAIVASISLEPGACEH